MKKILISLGVLLLLYINISFIKVLIVQYRSAHDILISLACIATCSWAIWKLVGQLRKESPSTRVTCQSDESISPHSTLPKSRNECSESPITETQPTESTVSYVHAGRVVHRADGQNLTDEDIEHLRETDFECAHQYYKNSSNPKFHRTVEEEMEQSKFYSANAEYIDKLQQDIWLPNLYSFSAIDDAIAHDQQALIAAQELSNFCSQSKAGQQYFEDMWLHCHNIQNPDFSIIDRIKDRYADLTMNYEERKKDFELHQKRQAFLQHADADVLRVIQSNPGILQKDPHKQFDPDLKPTIGTTVSHLVKSDQIRREKQGNSYSLYTK